MHVTWFILLISVLGPIIGSLIGVLKRPSKRVMYNMLSFAGGVMLTISFTQLIPESIALSSVITCALGVALGALVMYGLDRALPHIHPELCSPEHGRSLKRTALYLLIGIFLHNFPEGMAIAIGSASGMKTGVVVALAIGIHNIPEGICTSAPYYRATRKRLKAFLLSSSTALPIIAGFFFASALYHILPTVLVALMVAATAGVMIYITGDELIPTSSRQMTDHTTIFSLILGVLLVILLGM